MPLYEYRCKVCDDRFELRRPVALADEPATCPEGHDATARLLSAFAATGRAAGAPASSAPAPMAGPCGGNCACAAAE